MSTKTISSFFRCIFSMLLKHSVRKRANTYVMSAIGECENFMISERR